MKNIRDNLPKADAKKLHVSQLKKLTKNDELLRFTTSKIQTKKQLCSPKINTTVKEVGKLPKEYENALASIVGPRKVLVWVFF